MDEEIIDVQCAIYSIYYTFDGVGKENAQDFLLEHIFKVDTIEELNLYQRDLFNSIELVEHCNCLEHLKEKK